MSDACNSSERSTFKRLPARGVYDRAVIHQILDAGLVCHVGFAVDGQPFVIPTTYVRLAETIYVHGSPASRMLQVLGCRDSRAGPQAVAGHLGAAIRRPLCRTAMTERCAWGR